MSNSNPPIWNSQVILDLLSPHRMATYLKACNGDLNAAFALYRRNMDVAATILAITGMVEVVVRNAIDREMTNFASAKEFAIDWFDLPFLDSKSKKDISTAKSHLAWDSKPLTHARIVPQLTLGFWRFLTSKRYLTTLWLPAIQHAFPYGHPDPLERRRKVSFALTTLNDARNRAAHLEPVFYRNVQSDFDRARELMSWIHPDAALWFSESIDLP